MYVLHSRSAAGDEHDEHEDDLNDFKPSQVPGEGFVAAAKHNGQVAKTALRIFKDKALMFPMPMRRFLWEDYIYSTRAQKNPKVSYTFSVKFNSIENLLKLATLNFKLSNLIITKER